MLSDIQQKQTLASNPEYSIWTSASAGSGKTSVLVKRLLRMFLAGIEPSKILCITFTNTGAMEMRNRINSKLAEWVVMDNEELEKEIFLLEGDLDGLAKKVKIARSLFAKILDYSNDFKVLTIHSFCQQVIKRFPLEANIIPNFKVADDIISSELLIKAKEEILRIDNEEVRKSIEYIFTYKNEDDFFALLKQALNQKDNLLYLKNRFFSVWGVIDEVRKVFNLEASKTLGDLEKDFYKSLDLSLFTSDLCENIMATGKKTDLDFVNKISSQLSAFDFQVYQSIFLTQAKAIRKTIVTKDVCEKFPDVLDFISHEAQRVFEFYEKKNDIENFEFTSAFLKIVYCIFDIYAVLKKQSGYLDYNDLIFETSKLLSDGRFRKFSDENNYSSWINYKLDEGLDHLLIDEAQDTSPLQWEIVRSITDEFFNGYGQHGKDNRTIFVVGDEKQSIFSFQGAEPKNFSLMLKYYKDKIENCGKRFENVYLETSFRSLSSVLGLADEVFNEPSRKESITELTDKIKHNIFRKECEGRVEVWPLVENRKPKENEAVNEPDDWKINYLDDIELTNKQKLAQVIVDEIDGWFKDNRAIYSRKDKCFRSIKYSDIMILVKNRDKDFINYLIRQFNKKSIPTMGNDKFDLVSNIISQDIISLFKFLLFNEDDLNLANIVKSPFLNFSESDLYSLCEYKDKNKCSLWDALKNSFPDSAGLVISDLIIKKDELSIYEFLFYLFETKKMRKNFKERFNHTADDVINEFLNITNEYEKNHNNSTFLNFINFIENTELLIKRDMEQSSNEIRIMTIHSSKGLESPIVILPDTNHQTRTIQKIDRILNYKEDGNDYSIPIIQKEETAKIKEIKDKMKKETEDEYLRLLYVAITRAENELYIFDYARRGEPNKNSWYQILKESLQNMGAKSRKNIGLDEDILYVGDENIFGKKFAIEEVVNENNEEKLKTLLTIIGSNKQNPDEIKIINPSTFYTENNLNTPVENSDNIEKGKTIHKLLEILPSSKEEDWIDIIDIYLKNKNNKEEIKNIVLSVLNNKEFRFLFSKDSRSEVPVFGKIGKDIISGKIDRLAIVDNKVYIVDYKNTNKLPSNIPQKYMKQLELYKEVLSKIYTDKTIECYILWTSFGKMEKV